ncbi:MAG: radical SAM protein [Nanoarchaeota archaeon]
MTSKIIQEFNERKITNTAIIYVDKECHEQEKEPVCNINCLHCYYRFASRRMKTLNELVIEINKNILRGADHIQITGGEPTLHKGFHELIAYIKKLNVMCSVITNGHLLSVESFAKKAAPFVDYFLISFHAGTKTTLNKICQNDNAWGKVLLALDNLEQLKIEVHVNYTVMELNYKEIPTLVDILSTKSNVKRLCMICFNPWESVQKDREVIKTLIVSYDKMMPYIEEAASNALSKDMDVAIRYFPFCKVSKWLRPYNFNYSALIFDKNEWNYEMWFNKRFKKNVNVLYDIADKLNLEGTLQQRLLHAFGRFSNGFRNNFMELPQCRQCSHYYICDMPHKEQVIFFPGMEFKNLSGKKIKGAGYYFNKKRRR